MVVPDAVKQAGERVKEIEAEIDASNGLTEPVAEGAPETEVQTETLVKEPETPENTEGLETETVAGEPEIDLTPEPATETDWEQRYHSLQGKYNAEVPRLSKDVQFLQGQMEAMRVAPQPAPASDLGGETTVIKAGSGFKKYLTEKELEDYDEEILEFQSRVVRGVVEEMLQVRLAPIEENQKAVISAVGKQETVSFWDQVEAGYPGANLINDNDTGWVEFLNELDPLTQRPYRDIGEEAISTGNSGVIISLLELYEPPKEEAIPDKEVEPEVKPAGPPVKPSRSHGETAPKKTEKPMVKQSEIDKLAQDYTQGRISRDVYEKRQTILEEAVFEGRIIPG